MGIKAFEEIRAWQKGRELANLVYEVTRGREFRQDFELARQMRSASGSVLHNIAEGFDSGSNTEFKRFLRYSRRSASEVQSQAYLALDAQYITKEQFERIYETALEVKKLTTAFINYLSKTNR